MKGIIIYKSKYGSTRKYAGWLKEATGFEMVEADKAKIDEVAQCDTIIFGGGIYAGGIAGVGGNVEGYLIGIDGKVAGAVAGVVAECGGRCAGRVGDGERNLYTDGRYLVQGGDQQILQGCQI